MAWNSKYPTRSIFFTLALIISTISPLKSNWFFNKSSYGPFPEIETYGEIASVFNACDKNTLIAFDIDSTLIMSHDILANFEFPSLWFDIQALFKYPNLIWNKNLMEAAVGTIYEQSERFVFDKDIVAIIQQLRKREIPTVALSSMWSGSCGNIENMPKWRADMLNEFGINFDGQFSDVIFSSLPMDRGHHPCLYKGILCTNRVDKGRVLGAFLDHYHLTPKKIIFFDDQEKQLISVAKECNKRKFAFSGYQMIGYKKYCDHKWDTNRSLLQLDFLMNDKLWLTDTEADAILAGEIA